MTPEWVATSPICQLPRILIGQWTPCPWLVLENFLLVGVKTSFGLDNPALVPRDTASVIRKKVTPRYIEPRTTYGRTQGIVLTADSGNGCREGISSKASKGSVSWI
ncbi:hypothetical protein CIHG_02923 [Coccidioides immitis H538.4]|uniref:Uncharacterized protein n=3 Tax=Coccidioides immitis TaxID=5501 RepID=A0A0J8R1H1_COCIT|nr:hypothetical protein CIRG_07632 [Coccidioides immitis RMSCC 2394]KMU79014.1 hypothetical protein CISG_07321 [Coccidioides immitis RMSCC 3703]KMU85141.1 hypothetical protein CIHG_02923 [Coccidioides immitis H538.4]